MDTPRIIAQELRDLDRTDVPLRVRSVIERAIAVLDSVDESNAATSAPHTDARGFLSRNPSMEAAEGDGLKAPSDACGADAGGALPDCWCEACRPNTFEDMRMILCQTCGNKRCPHATNHLNVCTRSNEPGQKGSSWENVTPRSPAPPAAEPRGHFVPHSIDAPASLVDGSEKEF
ncbi:hypothetical protein QZM64_39625 [Burkholderia cepacia]|uniref:hypothetical protein n=1 Tax=Burkholderia cepacia complex TaxID=87882 RepID=UPI0011B25FFA|nr:MULTISPECIES: hypothetical protein [Burkholderia cepacia complex]MDN7445282.1 hypothetical protein [Burkholderia cepacia]